MGRRLVTISGSYLEGIHEEHAFEGVAIEFLNMSILAAKQWQEYFRREKGLCSYQNSRDINYQPLGGNVKRSRIHVPYGDLTVCKVALDSHDSIRETKTFMKIRK